MSQSQKRILLLATDCDSTRIVFNALKSDFEVCAVILEQRVPRRLLVKRRIEKLGLRTVLGQLAFQTLIVPALSARSRARIAEILASYNLDLSPIESRCANQVESVNSEECRKLLATYNPDVVVVNGTRILSQATLQATHARFINVHVGVTPLYRGVHGGYWALAQGMPEHFGITIHLVDTGIDTGAILEQGHIKPRENDNFVTYPYLQYGAGMPLLKAAIAAVLAGELQIRSAPPGVSRLWSHPTIAQYLRNRLLRRVR